MTLWAYSQTHSAFAVSLMTFCNYVPYFILSLFAGSFVDRHSKKAIMLITDSVAAVGTMAAINFFFRLTYENILSPMILARSGENNMVLGLVNAAMGAGGILGGILVTLKKKTTNKVRMMYGSAALSFLLGDLLMAVERNGILLGGVLADYVFEPFMMSQAPLVSVLEKLVGAGNGSGMACMFLCTGMLGFLISCASYKNKEIQALNE